MKIVIDIKPLEKAPRNWRLEILRKLEEFMNSLDIKDYQDRSIDRSMDADEVIRMHIDRLGMEIWRLKTDAEGRMVSVCTAAVVLLFNQVKHLEKKVYEEYMNVVLEMVRAAAWVFWEKAHEGM